MPSKTANRVVTSSISSEIVEVCYNGGTAYMEARRDDCGRIVTGEILKLYTLNEDGEWTEIDSPDLSLLEAGACPQSSGCCNNGTDLCFTNGTYTVTTKSTLDHSQSPPVVLGGIIIDSDGDASLNTTFTGEIPAAGYVPTKCQYNTTTEGPIANERTCYWYTRVDAATENALLSTAAVNGHERLTQRQWTIQQFANENDAGGGIENFHSSITLDHDGIPQAEGEVTTTAIAPSTAISESSTYGNLNVREGYLHIPAYYHLGANSGKAIAAFEIYDAYTSTTHSDRDEIYIGVDGTSPSMDRTNAAKVAEGQQGTSFSVPTSWFGETAYLALVHADAGNTSQVNWRVNITLEDGTILANQDLRDWTWELSSPPAQIGTIQEEVFRVYDTVAGTSAWYDATNTEITDADLLATIKENVQEHECGELPLTYSVTSLLGAVTIENPTGGAGGPYEYSFDGGKTWQTSATYTLGDTSDGTEVDIQAVRPAIRDANETYSAIQSPSVLVGDPVDQSGTAIRITDTVNDENNNLRAVESNDPTLPGGWSTASYSAQLGTDHLEALNNTVGLNWVLDETRHDNSFLYLGSQSVSPENSAESELDPILPVTELGEKYTVAYNPYNVYHGAPNTTTTFTAEVVDQVTSAVLGSKEYVWDGNTLVNLSNETFEFTGSGNPATLRFSTENDATLAGNWWGSTGNVTTTATSISKTAGTGWNTGVFSATSGNATDGVNVSFKRDGTGNLGMHGLDSDYTSTSYAGGDYLFYLYANNAYRIYQDGGSPYVGTASPNSTFEIDIATDGVVTYLVDGVVVYTSTVNAGDRDYYVASFPYTSGVGIDTIDFDGTDPTKVPDSTGHYVRVDNVRLFDGNYASATNHFIRVNNYIEARGVSGTKADPACLTKAIDDVSQSDLIRLTGNVTRVGTWDDGQDGWAIKYSLDNGPVQTAFEVDGNWDAANRVYATPFTTETIDTSDADEVQIWWCVWGDGDSAEYARLYDLGFEEVSP